MPQLQNPRPAPPLCGGGAADLLSELPDDVLHLILLRLSSATAAAQTSLLSRRWRHLWATLPDLRFSLPADLASVRAALSSHAAPSLLRLQVHCSAAAAPDAAAAVLHMAARRLTGDLLFNIETPVKPRMEPQESRAFELPCFPKATEISISLGGISTWLPSPGVLEKLTKLSLCIVRLDEGCGLGDAVSSARCPALKELRLFAVRGLSCLVIHSESLIHVSLRRVEELQQLTVFAPMLTELDVLFCFSGRQPVAEISAPALRTLWWTDEYDRNSVRLGVMPRLERLITFGIGVYAPPDSRCNRVSVELLRILKTVSKLDLRLYYPLVLHNNQYKMQDVAMLPNTETLSLRLFTKGHFFGPCVFHLLRISNGIRILRLALEGNNKAQTACLPGCFCNQPQDWETNGMSLSFLREVEFSGLTGAEREFSFLRRLWKWAVLRRTILSFNPSVTISDKLYNRLLSLSGPNTYLKIDLHHDGAKVMYTPAD